GAPLVIARRAASRSMSFITTTLTDLPGSAVLVLAIVVCAVRMRSCSTRQVSTIGRRIDQTPAGTTVPRKTIIAFQPSSIATYRTPSNASSTVTTQSPHGTVTLVSSAVTTSFSTWATTGGRKAGAPM